MKSDMSIAACLACIKNFYFSSKSVAANESRSVVTVLVSKCATKHMVKKAMELMFEVKVLAINSINIKGHVINTKRGVRKKSDQKKMMVRVDGGMTVNDMLGGS